jgi:hypothetical protein
VDSAYYSLVWFVFFFLSHLNDRAPSPIWLRHFRAWRWFVCVCVSSRLVCRSNSSISAENDRSCFYILHLVLVLILEPYVLCVSVSPLHTLESFLPDVIWLIRRVHKTHPAGLIFSFNLFFIYSLFPLPSILNAANVVCVCVCVCACASGPFLYIM